jgi:hypothetical protein
MGKCEDIGSDVGGDDVDSSTCGSGVGIAASGGSGAI